MKKLLSIILLFVLVSINIKLGAQEKIPANLHYLMGKYINSPDFQMFKQGFRDSAEYFVGSGVSVEFIYYLTKVHRIILRVDNISTGFETCSEIMNRWGLEKEWKNIIKDFKADNMDTYKNSNLSRLLFWNDSENPTVKIEARYFRHERKPLNPLLLHQIVISNFGEKYEHPYPDVYEIKIDPDSGIKWTTDVYNFDNFNLMYNYLALRPGIQDWERLKLSYGFEAIDSYTRYLNKEKGITLSLVGRDEIGAVKINLIDFPERKFLGVNSYTTMDELEKKFGRRYKTPEDKYTLMAYIPNEKDYLKIEFLFKDDVCHTAVVKRGSNNHTFSSDVSIENYIVKSGCIEGNCTNGTGKFLFVDDYCFEGSFKSGNIWNGYVYEKSYPTYSKQKISEGKEVEEQVVTNTTTTIDYSTGIYSEGEGPMGNYLSEAAKYVKSAVYGSKALLNQRLNRLKDPNLVTAYSDYQYINNLEDDIEKALELVNSALAEAMENDCAEAASIIRQWKNDLEWQLNYVTSGQLEYDTRGTNADRDHETFGIFSRKFEKSDFVDRILPPLRDCGYY
ncbi:MAG: hypothetical protein JXR58_04895 [Bacteroidales bacterium]|nr:hypothetical protein [Bacteroidales bacterium]